MLNPLRLAGHILLWVGFLTGTYLAVKQLEVVEDPWSTIEWRGYALAMLVGVTGVVLLRTTGRQAATHREKLEADIRELETCAARLLTQVGQWLDQQQQIDILEIHRMIDAQLMDSIDRFVTARSTLIHTYGLQPYVDVMSDFSVAERNINRAWSASADGYVDEVWLSLKRAHGKLERVTQRLAELTRQQPGLRRAEQM